MFIRVGNKDDVVGLSLTWEGFDVGGGSTLGEGCVNAYCVKGIDAPAVGV